MLLTSPPLFPPTADVSDEGVKLKEQALESLCALLVRERNAAALAALLRELRPLFAAVPKARTAKIVRQIVDRLGEIPGSGETQIAVCQETVEWCRAEKRSFLRIRVQLRLCGLLLAAGRGAPALVVVNSVLGEVKRLDDKQLLVEVHLLESRVHHALRNVPKARAALTAGRAAANSIYVGPELQAEIDVQAGTLSAEERDYRTGFSYFFEAFEGLNSLDNRAGATEAFKHMLMCKVMCEQPDDVVQLVNGKQGLKYAGRPLEAMRSVAQAYKDRSLLALERVLGEFAAELVGDALIKRHLGFLTDLLLEQNLLRLIEPFSCVEIAHVAALIGLAEERVVDKLSQMVLDKKFAGTLDQGRGQLLVFAPGGADKAYTAALGTMANLTTVVDLLHKRVGTGK